MRTSSTFNDISAEDLNSEDQKFPSFVLLDDENVEIATRILSDLGIRFFVEEKRSSIEFNFYNEFDKKVATRNIKRNIKTSIEGKYWK